MLKNLICALLFLNVLNADLPIKSINCSPELQKFVVKILHVSEIRQLIASIQAEGAFSIMKSAHPLSDQFGAFWDPDHRVISVNVANGRSEGTIIGSIIFELCNASLDKKFQNLDSLAASKKIGKEKYIESIEHLEFQNSLKANYLASQGVKLGLFPLSAQLPVYKDFKEHYYFQKLGGHSAWIGRTYDQLIQSGI